MPVTVVVGGQYGSEGKGKVALHVVKETRAKAVVRVGGSNSGHTAADRDGRLRTLRQLPASALASDCLVFLPAGSLIDPQLLLSEIEELGLRPDRLVIDEMASVITDANKLSEANRDLQRRIGSTGSGTGAAVQDRIARDGLAVLAKEVGALLPYTQPFVAGILRSLLDSGERVVVEGTQGFGLSVWHSPHYPFATSRDTTASGFASEVGLSPRDIDDIVLVIRALPIRVGGNSPRSLARALGMIRGSHSIRPIWQATDELLRTVGWPHQVPQPARPCDNAIRKTAPVGRHQRRSKPIQIHRGQRGGRYPLRPFFR